MPTKLTPEIISAAILGFEEQKRHIDANIAELRAILSGDSAESTVKPEPTKHKRRKMSAAGRARIAEAQRKRWAESKAASQPSTPEVTPKPKRRLSAAGRKAIVAATKKRWALKRAKAAKTQQAAPKEAAVKKAVAKKTAATSTLAAAKTAS
jgi:hypothetical protein